MIERVDDDGRLRFQRDRAEQSAFEVRANRKHRIEQQQQPPAARQVFVQQIRFTGRECGARTDIGNDRAVSRDGARGRRHNAAHLVADLGQRELQQVEPFRVGDQHVASARHVMAPAGFRRDCNESAVASGGRSRRGR